MTNRLAKETSPYLLQHKENPVDWYTWGEEALERAVEVNKPILLSIGYSSCHWCHVMEHESFENPEIAELMNRNFICIKVDREERPDLDQIYQNVAQALTRGGGWPLTVFLTPARKPFFGGTYFPPEDRYGRAGFKRVLIALSKAYQTDPIGVAQNAMKLTAYIQAAEGNSIAGEEIKEPDLESLERAAESLLGGIDPVNGGIGDAPKFPNAMAFSFLWRMGQKRGNPAMKEAVLLTLRKMASGGIYDQIGGGFSRYSVDATWSVPHFEKMLYDNGLLLRLYSEVLLSGDPAISAADRALFLSTIQGTVEYLLREMVSPEGGLYAAQDADSEGEEGKFFAWEPQELERVLPDEQERGAFSQRFGVNESGNFEHGKTVLYLARTPEEIARELGIASVDRVHELLSSAKDKVFTARSKRIPPGTDTKVLASWNGLAISGLSWAAILLREQGENVSADKALAAAERAFRLVSERMTTGQEGRLASTFQGGQPKHNGYLDDYAFMAQASLDLARATREPQLLSRCLQLASLWTKRVIRHFKDEKDFGYFFTSDDHEELVHRPKSLFDQAIPSGIAVTLEALEALAEIDEDSANEFSKEVEKQLFALFPKAMQNPFGCAELLSSALLYKTGPVVISGPKTDSAAVHPFVFRKPAAGAQDGKLLACQRRSCDAPYSTLAELKAAAIAKAR